MRRLISTFLALSCIALLALGAAVWWGRQWMRAPIATLQAPVNFEVPRGSTLRSVAMDLQQRGILDQPQLWFAWARLAQRDMVLKAGEYEIKPGTTPAGLLQLLSSGVVLMHSVTFIEGSTFADMRKLLKSHSAVRGEVAERSDQDVMRALGQPGVHPEGQFFPDTYRFARGTSDLELLALAHERLTTELAAAWKERAADLPLASEYEALILASIVEKETALDRERPLVSGVFIERLRRGMRLQTDPSVIYGIGPSYDGDIRSADLRRDTPYNTYTRAGLPPTPIALPGLASLRAAVAPVRTGAIFFVATGEADGSHYFSATLAEHEAAVQRYLRRFRQRNANR
jgi:UPF0755 protein